MTYPRDPKKCADPARILGRIKAMASEIRDQSPEVWASIVTVIDEEESEG